jgi:hypothetical protein
MLGYYWFLLPAHSHTSTILAAGAASVLALTLLEKPASPLRVYAAFGAVLGWAVTVRLQDVGIGWLAVAVFWRLAPAELPSTQKLARAAALVVAGLAALSIQLLHWRWRDGVWFTTSYNTEARFELSASHHLEVLFSPRHGLFLWHPAMLIALAGFLMWLWPVRREKPLMSYGLGLVGCFLSILAIGGFYSMWWFGDSFGSRPFLSVLPLFWIGLAWLWTQAGERRGGRAVMLAVLGVLALWNAVLAVGFHLAWISRSEALEPGRILEKLF